MGWKDRYLKHLRKWQKEEAPAYSRPPAQMTEALASFYRDSAELDTLTLTIVTTAISLDEHLEKAYKFLHKETGEDQFRDVLKQIKVRGPRKSLLDRMNLLSQMILCRSVDNYLTYLSDLLAVVFQTRPETLRSSEKVPLDLVLKDPSMDVLVGMLAERKVNELSYQGMRSIAEYLSDHLGFELFESTEDLEKAVEYIEYRNLIAHNRGTINRVFVSRMPKFSDQLGETLTLDSDAVSEIGHFLRESAYRIDGCATEKWKLPRPIEFKDLVTELAKDPKAPIQPPFLSDPHGIE